MFLITWVRVFVYDWQYTPCEMISKKEVSTNFFLVCIFHRVLNRWSWITLGQMHSFSSSGSGDTDRWHINEGLCATCQCPRCPNLEKRCICPKVIQLRLPNVFSWELNISKLLVVEEVVGTTFHGFIFLWVREDEIFVNFKLGNHKDLS